MLIALPGQAALMRERLSVEAVALKSLESEFMGLAGGITPGYGLTPEAALERVNGRLRGLRRGPNPALWRSIATSLMAGDLLGRWHAVRGELDDDAQFAEPGRILPDAPASWTVPTQIERAADYLWSKGLMTTVEFNALRDRYRAAGFAIAGEQERGFLRVARDSLKRSLERGMSAEDAAAAMNRALERAGYDALRPWHARLVAHMNFSQAYGAASWETLHDPRLSGLIPYFEYVTMHDEKVRPAHAAMHGYIAARDAQIWKVWWPPNGWNCRCIVRAVGLRRAQRLGLTQSEPWPRLNDKGRKVKRGGKAVYPDVSNGISFAGNPATWLKRKAR